MRIGYSLTQSEVVAAVELDYGDCARFQVTCPCCREAVFKKVRTREDGTALHFLSHYRAESAEAKECELRVAALSEAFLSRWSAEGRQQTLARFMRVLRRSIVEGQARLGLLPADEMRERADRLLRHPSMPGFAKDVERTIRDFYLGPDGRDRIREAISRFAAFGRMSEFWRRRQAAYVLDVFGHLTTAQMGPSLRYVVACAAVTAVLVPEAFPAVNKDDLRDEGVADVARALVAGRPAAVVDRLLARHSRRAEEMQRRLPGPVHGSVGVSHLGLEAGLEAMSRHRATTTAPVRTGLLTGCSGLPTGGGAGPDPIFGFRAQIGMAYAMARKKELDRQIADLNTEIRRIGMRALLLGPVIGLLASVPFPDMAAPPPVPHQDHA